MKMGNRLFALVLTAVAFSFAATAEEAESPLELPLDLQWCEPLEPAAGKAGITDTSESGAAYRADGEYLVTGRLWDHKGNYTLRFEPFAPEMYLFEVEFRIFRSAEEWNDLVDHLNKMLGPGATDVIASGVHGPDGEILQSERVRTTYADPDGRWTVTARQMSNEIDQVKFSVEGTSCRPADWEPGAAAYNVEAPASSEGRDDDIFSYDMWAEDPLHADTRAQEIEDERKAAEEKKAEEQDVSEIDWESLGEDDEEEEEIEW